jgi:hypothetical protein
MEVAIGSHQKKSKALHKVKVKMTKNQWFGIHLNQEMFSTLMLQKLPKSLLPKILKKTAELQLTDFLIITISEKPITRWLELELVESP